MPPQIYTIVDGMYTVPHNQEARHAFWISDTDPLCGDWDVGLYSRVKSSH